MTVIDPEEILERVKEHLEEKEEDHLMDYVSDGEGEDANSIERPVKLDESFPCAVFIANVPKVGQEKVGKLTGVLNKLLNKYGENEIHMPVNPATNQTDGFLLATYKDEEAANQAVSTLNGFALDKNHSFKVVKVDSFEEICNRSENYEEKKTFDEFSRKDFRKWLEDDKCREQLLIRYQDETEIHWWDTLAGEPVPCYCGEREKRQKKLWCDFMVKWSPKGSYLATFHKPGIALWAGPEFHKKVRFAHEAVKEIEFSPDEEFLLTWNGAHSSTRDDRAVRIFRVLTGECIKMFKTPTVTPRGGEFPHFLWSHDGQYFAECNETSIFIRESSTGEYVKDEAGKKKPLKYDGLASFDWSPKQNVISAWIPEKNNNPARLVLTEIPSRRELASRSRTQCEAQMHWQSEGDYLCLHVTKLSKTKKKGASNLEIFRIRDRNIPVDMVEVKDTVRGFYWETKGSRFAIITTDEAGLKPKLSFYSLNDEKIDCVFTFDLPSNSFNSFFWAPDGQYFVVAAISGGDLLWGCLNNDNKFEVLYKDEHFMLTDVAWDPSSRYVLTAVTQPIKDQIGAFKYQMEAGFSIWTFQGRALYKCQKEKLWNIEWRPHPPSALPLEHQNDIRKNLKQYSKKYDDVDAAAKDAARNAWRRERDAKMNAFKTIVARLDEYKDTKYEENGWDEEWRRIIDDQEFEEITEITEETLETVEEVISG